MKPFNKVNGIATPIDAPNVDTDQIAPARFLRRPRDEGYGRYLFHDLRFNQDGSKKPQFILNQAGFEHPEILVVNRNFGGGSSREQAVWALVDYGIRCIIGPSFGDIFFNNAINQGLLLIHQEEDICNLLRKNIHKAAGSTMSIDLVSQKIVDPNHVVYNFDISNRRKTRLLRGLDEIDLTLQFSEKIQAFEESFRNEKPWLFRKQEA